MFEPWQDYTLEIEEEEKNQRNARDLYRMTGE